MSATVSFVKSSVNKASTEEGGHYPPTTCYDYQYPAAALKAFAYQMRVTNLEAFIGNLKEAGGIAHRPAIFKYYEPEVAPHMWVGFCRSYGQTTKRQTTCIVVGHKDYALKKTSYTKREEMALKKYQKVNLALETGLIRDSNSDFINSPMVKRQANSNDF
ncbi:hypothetical protein Tco_1506251 [Tanacetum coccineum]